MNDNKLIAEFMGLYKKHDTTLYKYKGVDEKGEFQFDIKLQEMRYHTSWDWLMPVVIKCKESVDYCSDDNALKYHNIEDEMLSQLSIEDTYNAVVEFIKEHNDDTI